MITATNRKIMMEKHFTAEWESLWRIQAEILCFQHVSGVLILYMTGFVLQEHICSVLPVILMIHGIPSEILHIHSLISRHFQEHIVIMIWICWWSACMERAAIHIFLPEVVQMRNIRHIFPYGQL